MSLSRIDRRTLIGAMGASLALGATARAQGSALAFLALGDWGQQGGATQRQVAAAMGATALDHASRFVVSAGDNFYPAGVTSTADAQWRLSFEDVYTAPALQIPWFSALGNHDYRGDVQAQIDYSRLSDRWRMPNRYFKVEGAAFGAGFVDLFVIDTSPMVDGRNYDEWLQQLARGRHPSHESARQLAWLDQALTNSTAAWKIVVGHHPVYSGGHGDSPHLVERLAPMLEARGVQLYVNGHDHSLQHIRRGAVDYVCTGSGAEANDGLRSVQGTRYAASMPGFAAFRLTPDALAFEFRDQSGLIVYQADRRLGRDQG
ncbi:tartrate-resistant acid phosphatase type 5 family protein [Caulobacter sp.]|uniref:purple acid phosphatase family protein n=1 Tax=Caulobacter sp. TaxID=78 RepID=UPI002B471A69|nr:tartrate-resistant acid phosphatase type 5 family protein [Caulobacter sp.]HJV42159.1 tartrate-resistant acid phosphatase type 5 family protein [Caulobacter sp.]